MSGGDVLTLSLASVHDRVGGVLVALGLLKLPNYLTHFDWVDGLVRSALLLCGVLISAACSSAVGRQAVWSRWRHPFRP